MHPQSKPAVRQARRHPPARPLLPGSRTGPDPAIRQKVRIGIAEHQQEIERNGSQPYGQVIEVLHGSGRLCDQPEPVKNGLFGMPMAIFREQRPHKNFHLFGIHRARGLRAPSNSARTVGAAAVCSEGTVSVSAATGAWQTWGRAGKGSWHLRCSTAVFLQHADHHFGDALLGNGMQTDLGAAGSLAAPFLFMAFDFPPHRLSIVSYQCMVVS